MTHRTQLGDFTRDRRLIWLSALALPVGAIGAAAAFILLKLIAGITNLVFFHQLSTQAQPLSDRSLGIWALLAPPLGGLIIGLMARYGSDKIRGHGIPEALEAILFARSRMSLRVALLKPLSSAISIGTGGPFGAEGPIIMTGGACGSLFAQLFHLSPAERKTLLVAGAAAGMSAVFATPMAAVLLAVELLLFEWRPRSFVPVALAALVAAAARVPLLGAGPIFPVAAHAQFVPWKLVASALVGVLAGFASMGLTRAVYATEDAFAGLKRIHWMWWPALGGLLVGLGGLLDPRVLGVGYDQIHALLRGDMLAASATGLLLGKGLVWSVALGSGTSGGVLAPLLIMGGALGAVCGHWLPAGDAGLWACLGMAATMGGTMRSPLTATVFVMELTGDLNLLPGLLLACVVAHAVTVLMMPRSILTEKVARRGYHLTREYAVDPLAQARVSEVMETDPPVVSATMTIAEYSDRIVHRDPVLSRRQAALIVDSAGRLVGLITRGDLVRALGEKRPPGTLVGQAGSTDLEVAHPDELCQQALARMLRRNVGRLPVVSEGRLVGYLGRSALMAAHVRRLEEEQSEPGLLQR